MEYQHATGVRADSDFFDWLPDAGARFFFAPELAIAQHYPLRGPAAAIAPAPQPLALAYLPELPRSAC